MWSARMRAALTDPRLLIAVCSVTSAATGAYVGYVVANKKLEAKYLAISEKEIEDAKKFFADKAKRTVKEGEFATAESAAQALIGELHTVEHPASTEAELDGPRSTVEINTEVVNIFSSSETLTEDDAAEREEGHVYVITQTEFLSNESGYENASLTYFEGDDVLVDSDEKPIQDVEKLVGNTALEKFGHGTSDHNMVHVRNDLLELDIEIARSNGKYVVEVLGMDDPDSHLEHSGRPMKFRRYDD
jgi:hypothetical protein